MNQWSGAPQPGVETGQDHVEAGVLVEGPEIGEQRPRAVSGVSQVAAEAGGDDVGTTVAIEVASRDPNPAARDPIESRPGSSRDQASLVVAPELERSPFHRNEQVGVAVTVDIAEYRAAGHSPTRHCRGVDRIEDE